MKKNDKEKLSSRETTMEIEDLEVEKSDWRPGLSRVPTRERITDLEAFYNTPVRLTSVIENETLVTPQSANREHNDERNTEEPELIPKFQSLVKQRNAIARAQRKFRNRESTIVSEMDVKTKIDPIESFIKSEMKKNSSINDLVKEGRVGSGKRDSPDGGSDSEAVPVKNEKKCRVFQGILADDLPPLNSKIVRIFTSSTFTDTQLERNALMADVYPKIKDYCREKHGLEFQVVDMRWGVRDEATDDHMTTELCMNEIRNCQRLSTGPNFVVFLGQKYGYRPIPTIIDGAEFTMLSECTASHPEDLKLLNRWYVMDSNTVPAVFILRPISTIYKNFNNKRNSKLQENDANLWWDTMCQLTKILRRAAQVLFAAKKLDHEGVQNYYMSVTEREILNGILRAKDTADHTLAYIRDIKGLNLSLLRFARLFVDIAGRDIDQEAQKFLGDLRDKRIPAALNETNIARFTVNWTGKEGLDVETHGGYIRNFCDHFYDSITELVNDAVKKNDELMNDRIYADILQHLHMCLNLVKLFKGREEIIGTVVSYLKGKNSVPLVMYGESGCGKTSLLAKSASLVLEVYKTAEPVLLIRFLGTSPDSSTIQPLLHSLCVQISFLYDQPINLIPNDLILLQGYFKKLLACATEDRPMVIFLDSLDQISPADGAHSLNWLPVQLPPHCKFVVSSLPNLYGVLDTLFKIITSKENKIAITPLGENLGVSIINAWLENKQRMVTPAQWDIVNDAISKCNLPLYVKLVFDEICRWRSYSTPQETTLSHSVHEIINKLFERIENQHGKTLVSRALGYITASKSGLSEAELEDLLSLDEKVLNDVFQYHLPPVRRIPPLLWTRIRNDLPARHDGDSPSMYTQSYLTEREADGVNVINWYHRQFIDVCKERYFKNINFLHEMHRNIADYFLGTWGGGKEKPFEYSELQRSRFGMDKTGLSDRKVPLQPSVYYDTNGSVSRFNLRKLSELPYHLIRTHRFEDLYSACLFNYSFLHAKISSMPLQMTLADFEDPILLESCFDRDTKILADTIRLSASILTDHPDMLGPQIVGRLLPLYSTHPKIQSLIKQCDEEGIQFCALVPTHHCYHTPGGPLQYSLEGHPFAPYGLAVTSDIRYVVSASNRIIIFDLSTGEVFRTVNPGVEGIVQALSISPDDKYCVCSTTLNQVIICQIHTGDYHVIEKPVEENEVIGVSSLNKEFVVYNPEAWYIYSLEPVKMKHRYPVYHETPLMDIKLKQNREHQFILRRSDPNDKEMTFVIQNANIDDHFEFHSAVAVTKDGQSVYACIEISDFDIANYQRTPQFRWKYMRSFLNEDEVYGLTLSADDKYLAAAVPSGFKAWDLTAKLSKEGKAVMMILPSGIRNIPNQNSLNSLCLFSRRNEFFCAGVRKCIYVWECKIGTLVKTWDAHFARVCGLMGVTQNSNKLISASLDKTIKVWNVNNIYDDVYSIDRMERPVDDLCIADDAFKALAVTRNCLGIWNLETGGILKTLSSSGSSIISHAIITSDGKHIVSAESGNILIWDVDIGIQVHTVPMKNVQQLLLNEEDGKCIIVSTGLLNRVQVTCIKVPEGDECYKLEVEGQKKFKAAALACNGLSLVIPTSNKQNETNVLAVYHAKTGTLIHKVVLKYSNYQEYSMIVSMPTEPTQIGIIDSSKGVIFDFKKKSVVRTINKWNGVVNPEGKYGLYAPNIGGMEILHLTKADKNVTRTLISRVAEGVFSVKVMFTKNDRHVVYYHEGHRTIRIFRVSDCKEIAHYKCHAEVNVICGTAGGSHLMLGAVDGSVVMLTIADPSDAEAVKILECLPSRQIVAESTGAQNGFTVGSQIAAKVVAKARAVKGSKACLLQ